MGRYILGTSHIIYPIGMLFLGVILLAAAAESHLGVTFGSHIAAVESHLGATLGSYFMMIRMMTRMWPSNMAPKMAPNMAPKCDSAAAVNNMTSKNSIPMGYMIWEISRIYRPMGGPKNIPSHGILMGYPIPYQQRYGI